MSRSTTERARILLSRIAMGAVGVLMLVSDSAWEKNIVSGLLFLGGCILVSIGTIGRIWATLYVAGRKTHSLVTAGPYSITRNPLYLFSLIGGLGVAMTTETFVIPALFVIPFALYYPWVIRSEERRLRVAHGAEFDAYCRSVPAFWPRFDLLREEESYPVNAISFRRHIVDALWFVWFVGVVEFVEMLHEQGWIHPLITLR